MSRARATAAAVVAALALAPAVEAQRPGPPSLDGAVAAILVDARDGTPILHRDASEVRPIASATKLMTALLTLERASMDDVLAAPAYGAAPVESQIGLARGERMRVGDLFTALLIESANDAAVTLAEGISGSRAAFVDDMNRRAAQLGLADTSFANPIGLDDPRNHSSARDLATLARQLMRHRRFARTVALPSATLTSGRRVRTIENRNRLVARFDFVDGIKTGHTSQAGYVLVGAATGGNGAKVVSVVLGAPSEAARDADTIALLRYGLAQYRRVPALRAGRTVSTAGVAYRDERVGLAPARSLRVLARRGQRVRLRLDAPDELRGELEAGERVGRVAVVRDGEVVRRVALVTVEPVPGAWLGRRVASALGISLTALVLLGIVSGTAIVGMRARRRRRARARRARRGARPPRPPGWAQEP